ncbi:MAG TPA: hypothetical protein VKA44_04745 [Gemmatimonadota bacterium]|nr:hypothetical protein [Gemmatimonadota bacterium]
MHGEIADLIPVIALSIPLVALVGKYIVAPLADALTHRAETRAEVADPGARRELEELRDRVDGLERTLGRVAEEQAFQRALQSGEKLPGPGDPPPPRGPSAPPPA